MKSFDVKGILLIVVGFILVGGSLYWFSLDYVPQQAKACTQEAKLCPDGSAVGRTGPNCEFAECATPSVAQTDTINWKTYRNEEYGFEVKYPPVWILNEQGQDEISTPGGGERLNVEIKSTSDRITVSVLSAFEAPSYTYPIMNPKKVIIAGEEGLTAVKKVNHEDFVPTSFVIFSVKKDAFRYDLRFHDVTELSIIDQQILSTFKFIN